MVVVGRKSLKMCVNAKGMPFVGVGNVCCCLYQILLLYTVDALGAQE